MSRIPAVSIFKNMVAAGVLYGLHVDACWQHRVPHFSDWSLFWELVRCHLTCGYQCFDAARSSETSTKLYGVTSQGKASRCHEYKIICVQVSHVWMLSRKNLYCIVYVLSAVKVYDIPWLNMGNWFIILH
jgi:hypothetical protein